MWAFFNTKHFLSQQPCYLVKALSCLRQHFVVSSRCAMRKIWHNHWNGVVIWYDLYSLTLQTLVISICLPNNPWVTFMEFSGAFWLLVEWYIVTKWGLDKLNSICKDQQMREWLGTLAQDCFDWCFNGNGTPPQEAISQWWGKPFLVSDSTLLSRLGVPCGRSDTTTGMNYYMICYLVWSLQHNAQARRDS